MTLCELEFVYSAMRRNGYKPPMLDVGGVFSTSVAKYKPHAIIRTKSGHIWSNIDIECEATHDIESHSGSYHTIVSTSTLEHSANPFLFMESACRLLRDGGLLILSAPFLWHRHGDPGSDLWRFTFAGLKRLCDHAGLNVLESGDTNEGLPGDFSMAFVVASKGPIADRETFTGQPPI